MVITKEMQEDILRAGGSWYIPRPDNVTPKAKDALVRDMLRAIDARPGEKPKIRKRDFQGIPISLEYLPGERRIIRNDAGKIVYDRLLENGYGYFDGTRGEDGDEIDLILGPDNDSKLVFLIWMKDLGEDIKEREDEFKCAIAFSNFDAAQRAFCQQYNLSFFGGCETMTMRQFRPWLRQYAAH